ncbi:MAG TPA: hypothetical protein PK990_02050 [Salinivirgaceae bacterium]|nr:hypothetical protein [Salinivirgaceae bacterium]
MNKSKPRVIKDYQKLTDEQKEQIKLHYPAGYAEHLITYTDREGRLISALPFETEDFYYLIKMTKSEALQIVEDDDDFDAFGVLKEEVKEAYEEKYPDTDEDMEDSYNDYDQPEEMADDDYDDDDY